MKVEGGDVNENTTTEQKSSGVLALQYILLTQNDRPEPRILKKYTDVDAPMPPFVCKINTAVYLPRF